MFGPLVVAYLFLGGTGAGACLVASAVGLLVDRSELTAGSASALNVSGPCKRLLAPALAVAAGSVTLGVFCLLADLGSPEAALGVVTSGATSWANFGVAALVVCIVVCSAQLALLHTSHSAPLVALHVLQLLGILTGLGAAVYTGLLLMDMTGVPFWSTLWLAVLFALSAVSCGLAVFVIAAVLSRAWESFPALFDRLSIVDIAAIILEAAALALFLVHGMGSGAEASVERLLTGDLLTAFWVGAVFAGLVVPLVLEVAALVVGNASPYHLSTHVIAAGVFALVGAICLRYCVVAAGAHPFLGALGVVGAAVGW